MVRIFGPVMGFENNWADGRVAEVGLVHFCGAAAGGLLTCGDSTVGGASFAGASETLTGDGGDGASTLAATGSGCTATDSTGVATTVVGLEGGAFAREGTPLIFGAANGLADDEAPGLVAEVGLVLELADPTVAGALGDGDGAVVVDGVSVTVESEALARRFGCDDDSSRVVASPSSAIAGIVAVGPDVSST